MTPDTFKVALIPLDTAWADIDENILAVAERLRHVEPGTDLVVLPEMFSTGFITEPSLLNAYTEQTTLHTLDEIRRWSAHFGFAICGSIIAAEGSRRYNRAFLIEPQGDETFYDKHHLFSVGGEARAYTPGSELSPIVRFRGCNIMMLVCYDLRFPVWSRATPGREYDLLVYPANWPDSRYTSWARLLPARAIENQAFVAGCNRTGADDYGTYSPGHSHIFNDWGDDITTLDPDTRIAYATLDLAALAARRRKFPVWRDADSFTINS